MLLWLAFTHPVAALVVLVMLIALTIWLIPKVWRMLRAIIARVTAWFAGPPAGNPP
jgi:hypothetical protein